MISLNKAFLVGAVAFAASVGIARADTYNITVFNGNNPTPGSSTDAFEQALPGAGSIYSTGTNLGTYTYTGPINFNDPSGGSDTIKGFLATGTGTFSTSIAGLTETLSGSNFTKTTGLEFNITVTAGENLTFAHDDGVSLFKGGTNYLPTSASSPTTEVDSTATDLAAGTYTVYYIEANGLPADLIVTVPEPVSMSLLGAGLIGLGLVRRKRT